MIALRDLLLLGAAVLAAFGLGVTAPFLPWGFTVHPDVKVSPRWLGALTWVGILLTVYLASRWFLRARLGFWWNAGVRASAR
jgi:hypothetical protein